MGWLDGPEACWAITALFCILLYYIILYFLCGCAGAEEWTERSGEEKSISPRIRAIRAGDTHGQRRRSNRARGRRGEGILDNNPYQRALAFSNLAETRRGGVEAGPDRSDGEGSMFGDPGRSTALCARRLPILPFAVSGCHSRGCEGRSQQTPAIYDEDWSFERVSGCQKATSHHHP